MWINEYKVSKIVLNYITKTLIFLATVGYLHFFFPKNVTLKRKLARLAYNKESKENILPEHTELGLTERWNNKFAYQKSLHFIQLGHLEN